MSFAGELRKEDREYKLTVTSPFGNQNSLEPTVAIRVVLVHRISGRLDVNFDLPDTDIQVALKVSSSVSGPRSRYNCVRTAIPIGTGFTMPKARKTRLTSHYCAELHNGDSMAQKDFHLLYEQMADTFRAELIGGIVYVCDPVGRPHSKMHVRLSSILDAATERNAPSSSDAKARLLRKSNH